MSISSVKGRRWRIAIFCQEYIVVNLPHMGHCADDPAAEHPIAIIQFDWFLHTVASQGVLAEL